MLWSTLQKVSESIAGPNKPKQTFRNPYLWRTPGSSVELLMLIFVGLICLELGSTCKHGRASKSHSNCYLFRSEQRSATGIASGVMECNQYQSVCINLQVILPQLLALLFTLTRLYLSHRHESDGSHPAICCTHSNWNEKTLEKMSEQLMRRKSESITCGRARHKVY